MISYHRIKYPTKVVFAWFITETYVKQAGFLNIMKVWISFLNMFEFVTAAQTTYLLLQLDLKAAHRQWQLLQFS